VASRYQQRQKIAGSFRVLKPERKAQEQLLLPAEWL